MSLLELANAESARQRAEEQSRRDLDRLEREMDRQATERRHQDALWNARLTRFVAIGSLIVSAIVLLINFFAKK